MGATIIYVDDDDDLRDLVRMALAMDGSLETIAFASGAEALAAAPGLRPDLILLDVMMPGMDGPATMRGLQDHAHLADVPVVFITANTRPGEAERLLALGAAGLIAKPFDAMRLGATLRGYLT